MRSVLFPYRQWNLKVLFAFSQGQGARIIWLPWSCYKLNDLIKNTWKKTSQLSGRKYPEISTKCNCILYVILFRAEKQEFRKLHVLWYYWGWSWENCSRWRAWAWGYLQRSLSTSTSWFPNCLNESILWLQFQISTDTNFS